EGELAGSGGICIREHIVMHIALPYYRWDWEHVLAHEFAHMALAGLPLPLWLEEGVVQVITNGLVPRAEDSRERLRRLTETRQYWRDGPLPDFWSGDAFSDVESQEHAYRLSEVLATTLLNDHPREFKRFFATASYEDHGESAAAETFGKSLNQLAAMFVGDRKPMS
ncbi:MAG: hypothetical protein KDA58_15960, partial [Planctomycetaceae bacterium]|nr:hypothetical protein [Planctomycetaceae bacterium]